MLAAVSQTPVTKLAVVPVIVRCVAMVLPSTKAKQGPANEIRTAPHARTEEAVDTPPARPAFVLPHRTIVVFLAAVVNQVSVFGRALIAPKS